MGVVLRARPEKVMVGSYMGEAMEALAALACRIAAREGSGKFLGPVAAAFDFSRKDVLRYDPNLSSGVRYDTSRKGLIVADAQPQNPGFEDPVVFAGWERGGFLFRLQGGAPEGSIWATVTMSVYNQAWLRSTAFRVGSALRVWHYTSQASGWTRVIVEDLAGQTLKDVTLPRAGLFRSVVDTSGLKGLLVRVRLLAAAEYYTTAYGFDFLENMDPPSDLSATVVTEGVPIEQGLRAALLLAGWDSAVQFSLSTDGGATWHALSPGREMTFDPPLTGSEVRLRAILGPTGVLRWMGVSWTEC